MPPVVANVLFIIGAPRSGSTVFEQYLVRAAGTVATGEAGQVWVRGRKENWPCTCGRLFGACPFWSDVLADVDRRMGGAHQVERIVGELHGDLARLRTLFVLHHRWARSRSFSRRYREEARLLDAFYGAIASTSGAPLIVDGTKGPPYGHLLSTLENVRVAFVFLIRDSRGVVNSWQRVKPIARGNGVVGEMFRMSTWLAIRQWVRSNLTACALLAPARSRMITVSYEEFARRPEATLERVNDLLAHLGMPTLAGSDPTTLSERYHSFSGNPARFDIGAPVREDDGWRTELTWRDRLVVTLATAPLLLAHHVLLWRRTGDIGPRR